MSLPGTRYRIAFIVFLILVRRSSTHGRSAHQKRAGYSAKTANAQAARLLANVSVQARTQALKQERAKATQITAEYVLNTIFETVEGANVVDLL